MLRFVLCVAMVIVWSTTTAWAQDKSLDDLLSDFEEIIITVASKTQEKAEMAPSSVTVLTHQHIHQMGITSLQELLNFVPGFQATRDVEQGTADRISARGRGTALSESVLFMINGQRLNDLYTGGISILNRLIAVDDIKQVEIIRGPGSALYGSNAFLGVVNIVTVDNSTESGIALGSNGYQKMSANFHSESNGLNVAAFGRFFTGKGQEYDDLVDAYGLSQTVNDPRRGVDGSVTASYKNLKIYARYMERALDGFMTFGTLSQYNNNETTRQTSVTLSYDDDFSDDFKMNLTTGYAWDRWFTQAVLIPQGIELAPDFALSENFIGGPLLESYQANLNLDLSYHLSKTNELLFGASYTVAAQTDVANVMSHHPVTLELQPDVTAFRDAETVYNEEETRTIFGAYIQDKMAIGDQFRLFAGIRFDHYNDFGSSLNPRAAAIFSTPFQSNIKLMYGEAFRAPNFLELYDRNNPVDFGNPNLDAEKVRTIEAAYVQNFEGGQFAATYFRNTITDQIIFGAPVEDPYNPFGSPSFENAGEDIETAGLEFELSYAPVDPLKFYATFTHFLDESAVVSTNFASFMVNYHQQPFNFNLNGIYRDEVAALPDQEAYFLLNSNIVLTMNYDLKLQLTVKNLLDEDYRTVTAVPIPGGVANRGRTIVVGLIYGI